MHLSSCCSSSGQPWIFATRILLSRYARSYSVIAGYCNWSYHPALASTPVQHARVGHSPIGAENTFGQGHCTPSRRTLEYFIPSLSALFIPLILGKKKRLATHVVSLSVFSGNIHPSNPWVNDNKLVSSVKPSTPLIASAKSHREPVTISS